MYFCYLNSEFYTLTMDGLSQTPKEERIKMLQSILPEAFCEGKIDWEKLKATLGEDIDFSNERYVLNWAGKSDAFRVMQKATSATLVPCREESVDFDNTQNIFIEGENLEVLKALQKSYFGKVKMIYIDPPYNTGNDSFVYPDKFSESKEEYMRRVGDKDENGYMVRDAMFRKNSKENGQYHSNWLNMMMPRLYLAKSLLREDGVIFVSIDDNEVHNLRLLMNEIFGEDNFVAQFLWKKKSTTSNVKDSEVSQQIDYQICYRKTDLFKLKQRVVLAESRNYPYSDDDGNFRTSVIEKKDTGSYKRDTMKFPILGYYPREGKRWQIGEDKARLLEKKNRFFYDGEKIQLKIYDFEETDSYSAHPTLLDQHGSSDSASRFVNVELLGVEELFDNPKPVELVKFFVAQSSNYNDIILDFFAGSGTTAHAVMQLNKEDGGSRKYICVQLPELCDDKSEAYKAGYKTIAEISKERIRRASAKIHAEIEAEQAKQNEQLFEDEKVVIPDLGFKVFKLADSNFKQWREIKGSDKEAWQQQMLEFIDPIAENATTDNMVYELLLKSGKDLNSTIEHCNGYYAINGNELVLMLETTSQEIIDEVIAVKPTKVIALDKLFEGNDQLKTNTALQMRDAGVEFKTI